MTQNLHIGSDVAKLLDGDHIWRIPYKVRKLHEDIRRSRFGLRAEAVARYIRQVQPDIVALQEVALLKKQSPGDFFYTPSLPASKVVVDFLEVLLGHLNKDGTHYEVVSSNTTLDVELPMLSLRGLLVGDDYTLVEDAPGPILEKDVAEIARNEGLQGIKGLFFDDIRGIIRDVILKKTNIQTRNAEKMHYEYVLEKETSDGKHRFQFPRGVQSVIATIEGREYKFVNTHLENEMLGEKSPQREQAKELVSTLNAQADKDGLPIILLGDFNSDPQGKEEHTTPYSIIEEAGFTDTWNLAPTSEQILNSKSCCHSLLSPTGNLDSRIDLVWFKAPFGDVSLESVNINFFGNNPETDKIEDMWPSDHAGVFTILHIKH